MIWTRLNMLPRSYQSQLRKLLHISQQAVFASKIIRLIRTCKNPNAINDQTLLDQIKGIQLNNEELQFDKQIKQDILQMFERRIFLDNKVQNQTKTKQQNFINQQLLQEEKIKLNFEIKQTQIPFMFYPNYLVTPQIFDTISDTRFDFIITGDNGISKTISLILFIQLSKYINKLQMQAKRDPKAKQEYNVLIKKKLVLSNHSKYWYWTIDFENDWQEKFSIQNLIKSQATELTQEQMKILDLCESFQSFKKNLDQFYSSIGNIVIIDQVNALTQKMLQWNQFVFNYQKFTVQQQLLQSNIKKLKNPIHNLLKKFRKFRKIGQKYLLNSSITIEKDILGNGEYSFSMIKPFYLDLRKHNQFQTKYIPFQQSLTQHWGKIAFLQYIWFQIEKSLFGRISLESVKKMKLLYEQQVKNRIEDQQNSIVKSYYRLNHIHDFINYYYKGFKEIDQTNYSTKLNIKTLFKQLQNHVKNEWAQKLYKFVKKNLNSKKLFLALCSLAEQQIKNKQIKRLQVNLKQLSIILNIAQEKTLLQLLKSKENNKKVLPLSQQFYFKIDILLMPQEFVDFAKKVILNKPIKISFNQQLKSESTIKILLDSNSSRGSFLQKSLIKCLLPNTKISFYSTSLNNKTKQMNRFDIQLKKIIVPFRPFNQSNKIPNKITFKPPSIKQNFRQIQQISTQNLGLWFAGLPIWQFPEKQHLLPIFEGQNPSTDFIFVRVASINKLLNRQIYSFDVTVSKDLSQKIRKAKKLYQPLLMNQQQPYYMTHFILAQEQTVQIQKAKIRDLSNFVFNKSTFKIQLVPLKHFDITDCSEEDSLETFNILKSIKNRQKLIQKKK